MTMLMGPAKKILRKVKQIGGRDGQLLSLWLQRSVRCCAACMLVSLRCKQVNNEELMKITICLTVYSFIVPVTFSGNKVCDAIEQRSSCRSTSKHDNIQYIKIIHPSEPIQSIAERRVAE